MLHVMFVLSEIAMMTTAQLVHSCHRSAGLCQTAGLLSTAFPLLLPAHCGICIAGLMQCSALIPLCDLPSLFLTSHQSLSHRPAGEDEVRRQLTEAFGKAGKVVDVRLPTDRESGELKGFGFINFESADAKVRLVSAVFAQGLGTPAAALLPLRSALPAASLHGATLLLPWQYLHAVGWPTRLKRCSAGLCAGDESTLIQRRKHTCGSTNRAF
jgi:hypothetical protein